MMTPAMYAAMTGSVLQHAEGHIKTALSLCGAISDGKGGLEQRLQDANALIVELEVVRSDMERALLFLGIDRLGEKEVDA